MDRLKIALVGFGHIARTRHVPVIASGADFEVVAVVGAHVAEAPAACRVFVDHCAMLSDTDLGIEAVAICTPPGVRRDIARDALLAGKHVLLEKPPTSTLGELNDLRKLAQDRRLSLFTAWHSQFNAAVDEARLLLRDRTIAALKAVWHEDVERWHPGQAWIWQPKGLGVFDAGVNAISILTRIVPTDIMVRDAQFTIEQGRQAPIAARLTFGIGSAVIGLSLDLDWRPSVDLREMEIETDDGLRLNLTKSGRCLAVNGVVAIDEENLEYPRLYAHFRSLIEQRASDVDADPLRLVADASLVATRLVA